MSKRAYEKNITIKEYTKNYKFPENNKVSQEDEYIHRTQNTFLARILRNKNVKIPQNEDINKTIQIIFHKEENRKRMINILKRRNHKVSRTSERLSISKTNTQDISYDSIHNKIKGQESFDSHTPFKKYNKLNLYTKKIVNKGVTPLVNNRNKKKIKINENNKSKYLNKEKNNEIHSKVESDKFINNKNNNNNVNINIKNKGEKIKNKNNNEKPYKIRIISLKIEKGENIFYKSPSLIKSKINLHNDYKPEKCDEIIIKRKEDINSGYIGYVILKKNFDKIEKEIKLEKEENKLKEIFSNLMKEIIGEEYEFITKKELLKLNEYKKENDKNEKKLKEKEEINIKEKQKIKEQEKLIQENKELYSN